MEWMLESGKAATTVFNVLETLGVLSFNLNSETLLRTAEKFTALFGVKVYWPAGNAGDLNYDFGGIFEKILNRQSLGDAQITWALERFRAQTGAFVTWNLGHYEGKTDLPVMTPAQFLRDRRRSRQPASPAAAKP